MPGGPILPFSAIPITADRVFAILQSSGEMAEALGYQSSLGADSIWRLYYLAPQTIPSGTATMLLRCQANATTGNARLNVKWKSWGANEVPASASLNAEGVTTITFATTAYRLTEVTLLMDADTFVAGELVMVDLVGETASWTLATPLAVLPPPIYWI